MEMVTNRFSFAEVLENFLRTILQLQLFFALLRFVHKQHQRLKHVLVLPTKIILWTNDQEKQREMDVLTWSRCVGVVSLDAMMSTSSRQRMWKLWTSCCRSLRVCLLFFCALLNAATRIESSLSISPSLKSASLYKPQKCSNTNRNMQTKWGRRNKTNINIAVRSCMTQGCLDTLSNVFVHVISAWNVVITLCWWDTTLVTFRPETEACRTCDTYGCCTWYSKFRTR